VLRLLVWIVFICAFVYFGATVKLGKRTLFGHVRAIWHTEEVQDLKEGVKEKAGPTVDRVKRGVERGYDEMKKDDSSAVGSGSAGSGSAVHP
jgi:hypothetical protein